MGFLDVNKPDTSWSRTDEDPIPVIFGRWPVTATAYRFITCRPLDGRPRTDATFWHAGTKSKTQSGKTLPYQYWPGWKRGLVYSRVPAFVILPYTTVAALNEHFLDAGPWWIQWPGAVLPWMPHLAWGGNKLVRYAIDHKHERNVVEPIRAAAINILRNRDITVNIPRSLVKSENPAAEAGSLILPMEWSGAEGDRENLVTMLQERLDSPIACSFDMAGRSPTAKITIPAQPPKAITWERFVEMANSVTPYLGDAAGGVPMFWDLGDDSPHMGIVGGSGSGKSELMAAVVAQFMRGGAGTVVLDPKGTSHGWLLRMPKVHYCGNGQMIHDTIMWLDSVMDERAAGNREAVMRGGGDRDYPRIVVVMEERNSLQDKLRDHWAEVKPQGAPAMSPAIRALDRLSSMGRTLGFTVLLAAQATAQADIGKKNNYGAWSIAGRMAANHYKNIGVTPKPAIAAKPGRFAYVVAGEAKVFQAAYPNLKTHTDRLAEWATQGDDLLDIKLMMMAEDGVPFPSSEASSSTETTQVYVTLGEFQLRNAGEVSRPMLDNARIRDASFPSHVDKVGAAFRYRLNELDEWLALRRSA